ncbi:hypothetical protein QAD02_007560 [Eretmocerus hayati]|uniref:Uncharacterized protein n=1 Tax=Eretmocerus hayati TaxID=131215 RepID=A0ACC2N591_9HYME|nr:hypothetical protein QAD02_007560 [Eretmocerus hayati]
MTKKYPRSEVFLCGDFNLPDFKWCSKGNLLLAEGVLRVATVKEGASSLEKCVNQFNLTRFFELPNDFGNTLDLIFTDLRNEFSGCIDPLIDPHEFHLAYEIIIPCVGR